jgi:phenylalanyl-tRNA synthetase alpha chain
MSSPSISSVQSVTISDDTRRDVMEIDTTGTLVAGEKALAELRKRKLVVQK